MTKVNNAMKSYMAKKGEVVSKWYLVDVADQVVGRMAVKIATILMGKHRPTYTPHVDTGEFVIVVNAAKVRVTGANKLSQRTFERYSKYPSGRRVNTMTEVLDRKPEMVLYEAVRRMLPKTKMGMAMITKFKVYPGSEHPHQAQMPEKLEL